MFSTGYRKGKRVRRMVSGVAAALQGRSKGRRMDHFSRAGPLKTSDPADSVILERDLEMVALLLPELR